MRAQMMDMPLLISSLLHHADRHHGEAEIVSRTGDGSIHRYTYHDAHDRARRLAGALVALGVAPGDRVATLAWNGYRHLECYYGIAGMGAVCHTVNPRLFPQQIAYILNHAEDALIFADPGFVPILENLSPHLDHARGYVILADRAHMPVTTLPNLLCYEELLEGADAAYQWPALDENLASSLCYTSGTTGHPKGVLYSHRSTVLHSYAVALPDSMNISARDTVLPVVPMFHVNAWGLPYVAPMTGAKLVLPGSGLDGASLYELFETEKVTVTAGVPTVWLGLLQYLQAHQLRLSTLERVIVGGSALPAALTEAYAQEQNVRLMHLWGMTELSPVGTVSAPKSRHAAAGPGQVQALQRKQGRAVFGVDMKIVGASGEELPWDGVAVGDLLVRGPWVVSRYFRDKSASPLRDGWFPTGDVASIDPDGYMQITDRSKDMIKSGGEWISSIDLENAALGFPGVAEAAVIGVHHPKWDERPLLLLVAKSGTSISREGMRAFLAERVAKWWLPDEILLVDELPHTATGKLLKTKLREIYRDYPLPAQDAP